MNVYHGICAWAEGQLEGEPACPDCPTAPAALWGRLPAFPDLMGCRNWAKTVMTSGATDALQVPSTLVCSGCRTLQASFVLFYGIPKNLSTPGLQETWGTAICPERKGLWYS